MTYDDLEQRVLNGIPIPTGATTSNLTTMLPAAIDYAENRLCRDVDFLALRQSVGFTATSATLSISNNPAFIVVEDVITGTGPLQRQTKEYIYSVWITEVGFPIDYAMLDHQTILFGPQPTNTGITVIGTCRPVQLSPSNPSNWLSLNVPDMYLAAALRFLTEWIGVFADDMGSSQKAMKWEEMYMTLFKGAYPEEFRRKSQSQGFTQQAVSPSTAPRT